jgi:hypothetical protein
MKRWLLGCALGALAVAALAGSSPAAANGVPQLVKLTYLQGVSNTGPKDAEGVLEFSFAEAYARVDIKNLPPQDGYTLEGWLTGGGKSPVLVGQITPNASGIATLDTKLSGLPSYDYNMFVVAARKAGDTGSTLPGDLSIAGRFTVIGDQSGAASGDVRPGSLPDTGQRPAMTTRERIGRTVTIMAGAAGLAVGVLYVLRRRKVHA